MGVFLRRSRADNFIVPGPIWPKFELLLDIMHDLDNLKFKMDRINSNDQLGSKRELILKGRKQLNETILY